jgi:hypothetical protein
MDISRKSIAMMIDELITTSMRCWFAQEMIMNKNLLESQRLEAAERAQIMNAKRAALMKAIDEKLGDGEIGTSLKTYYTYFDKENK